MSTLDKLTVERAAVAMPGGWQQSGGWQSDGEGVYRDGGGSGSEGDSTLNASPSGFSLDISMGDGLNGGPSVDSPGGGAAQAGINVSARPASASGSSSTVRVPTALVADYDA